MGGAGAAAIAIAAVAMHVGMKILPVDKNGIRRKALFYRFTPYRFYIG
jgi:malic enzyme